MEKIHMKIAHDGGNGYMKDAINGKRVIFPSVLSRILPGNEPSKVDLSDMDNVKRLLDNCLDYMDIDISSNSIKENGRYFVGNLAANSGAPLIGFNVNSNEGKSNSDVSLICLLALISYCALKQYFRSQKQIPKEIDVSVDALVTALPIDEIKIPGVRDKFAQRFLTNKHKITIKSFSQDIDCYIEFKKVDVQPEGVIGQYGLIGNTDKETSYRKDNIYESFKKKYNYKNFDGETVLKIGNVLSIDIGDGTVDFSVLNGASPVPHLNSSILLGVGNVTEDAVQALHQRYPMYGQLNRQAFMKIAERGKDSESSAFRELLREQLISLESRIEEKVKEIYARVNNQINLIVVCGGGADILHTTYGKQFEQTINSMSPFGSAPILWVPKEYDQMLNLDGLQFRLNQMR